MLCLPLPLGKTRASARHTSGPPSPGSESSEKTAVEPPSPGRSSSECSTCYRRKVESHQSGVDPKDDLKQVLHGWPELVKLMADHPEFVSFPAFRKLNIKSLLYYQCQLSKLEKELHEIEWDDHRSPGFAEEYCQNIDTLLESKDEDEVTRQQLDKLEEIRGVLIKYNDALIQFSQINALPQPDCFNVDCLRQWIKNPRMGGAQIKGAGRWSWGDISKTQEKGDEGLGHHLLRLIKSPIWPATPEEICPDLVTPHHPEKIDGLTRWVANNWVPFWEYFCKWISGMIPEKIREDIEAARQKKSEEKSPKQNDPGPTTLVTYSMNAMLRFTSRVATLVACLLPIVAITVLSKLHTNAKVLGFIALFTALFALGLMGLTPPGTSRTEIFTATAAFSAVLVVFVQNQNGNTNGS